MSSTVAYLTTPHARVGYAVRRTRLTAEVRS